MTACQYRPERAQTHIHTYEPYKCYVNLNFDIQRNVFFFVGLLDRMCNVFSLQSTRRLRSNSNNTHQNTQRPNMHERDFRGVRALAHY